MDTIEVILDSIKLVATCCKEECDHIVLQDGTNHFDAIICFYICASLFFIAVLFFSYLLISRLRDSSDKEKLDSLEKKNEELEKEMAEMKAKIDNIKQQEETKK